jgi:hypothetical protein
VIVDLSPKILRKLLSVLLKKLKTIVLWFKQLLKKEPFSNLLLVLMVRDYVTLRTVT